MVIPSDSDIQSGKAEADTISPEQFSDYATEYREVFPNATGDQIGAYIIGVKTAKAATSMGLKPADL